jgi:hypothetical protein
VAQLESDRQEEYKRYGDFYDGRPKIIEEYFQKRHFETQERFADRPKLSWPLCRPIADGHAEALAKGIQVSIAHDKTQETWDEISRHNNMAAFWKQISSIISVYGACGVKPMVVDNKTTQKAIEFDALPPDTMFFIYERGTGGRSVKRFIGVAIITGYSLENGTILPWPVMAEIAETFRVQQRVEFISADRWIVWLDNQITPIGPHGDIWMPDPENGENPFPEIMATLYNGLETYEDLLGASDIRQGVYDVQTVNEIWSDLIYMFRMYVPLLFLKSDNPESRKTFKAGVGIGFAINSDEDLGFAQGQVDWTGVMLPLKIALELTYSNSKMPAVAVGLGHVFGDASVVTGVGKEFEWKPTVANAKAKREPFTRGVKDHVRKALMIAEHPPPIGQGITGLDLDAEISVEYADDIIPTSMLEELEKVTKLRVAELISGFEAMKRFHKWDDARAAREMDLIKAESRSSLTQLGFDKILEVVMEQQGVSVTEAEKAEAKETLLGASAAPTFDKPPVDEGEEADEDEDD